MMNSVNKIYVVGEKFRNIVDNEGVYILSDIEKKIETGKIKDLTLHLEQGINEHQICSLKEKINKLGLPQGLKIKSYFDDKKRCESRYTHKHKNYNTLISSPEKTDENIFFSLLMIDDSCAELSDHTTGQHIQAMVIIEAARQMTLAVTEQFYLERKDGKNNQGFVLNSINTNFISYLFPCNTLIKYEVVNFKSGFGNNKQFTAKIDFYQTSEIKATVYADFSVMDICFLNEIEKKLVKKTLAMNDGNC